MKMLTIKNGELYLDGEKVECVKAYIISTRIIALAGNSRGFLFATDPAATVRNDFRKR